MDLEAEKCPKCGNVKCLIIFYWEGKTYTYRRDDNHNIFRVFTAVQRLEEINKAIKNPKIPFKPKEFTDTSRLERQFENQFQEYLDEKEGELKAGEAEPETLLHDQGLQPKSLRLLDRMGRKGDRQR